MRLRVTGKPVAGTTSLALMMHAARAQLGTHGRDEPLAIAIDARRGEVYFQIFGAGGLPDTQLQLLTYAAAVAAMPRLDGTLVGSGGPRLAEFGAASATTLVPLLPNLEPDAGILAEIADTLPVLDPVKPLYLRAPDAKPQTGKSLPRAPHD